MLGVKSGFTVRFEEEKVREMGRTAAGVRGISLADEMDEVVGMVVTNDENHNFLALSEKGYGKQTTISEYRLTNRGGKGVKTINVSEKTGKLIAIKLLEGNEDLMIITKMGITIRMSVNDISTQGRNTQGVRLIRIKDGDEIASITSIMEKEPDAEAEAEPENGTTPDAQ